MTAFDLSSSRSIWWARIKYEEGLLDSVPVNEISYLDYNLEITLPFEPKHLNDFVYGRYYEVRTNRLNTDGRTQIHNALIGRLSESEESLKSNTQRIRWPNMERDESEPEDITSNFTKILKKRIDNNEDYFDQIIDAEISEDYDDDLTDIKDLVSHIESLTVSIQCHYQMTRDMIITVKKRLYTDISVYVEGSHYPIPNIKLEIVKSFDESMKCIDVANRDANDLLCALTSIIKKVKSSEVSEMLQTWIVKYAYISLCALNNIMSDVEDIVAKRKHEMDVALDTLSEDFVTADR